MWITTRYNIIWSMCIRKMWWTRSRVGRLDICRYLRGGSMNCRHLWTWSREERWEICKCLRYGMMFRLPCRLWKLDI
ncbi:hypothetical protein MtrunA17_Chr2g0322901 [Medicago truncatula]|uniref:Uncharacterized protein n=1 Tax=Medicago truncatula TaxID=3880 RepID=A0A396JBD1_MEDTR|nr:hypothetical protein MtrunA17_Chr2g0322901 [Medicago truncatula]